MEPSDIKPVDSHAHFSTSTVMTCSAFTVSISVSYRARISEYFESGENIQGDSFGTRPKKMRISQRLFIRF